MENHRYHHLTQNYGHSRSSPVPEGCFILFPLGLITSVRQWKSEQVGRAGHAINFLLSLETATIDILNAPIYHRDSGDSDREVGRIWPRGFGSASSVESLLSYLH